MSLPQARTNCGYYALFGDFALKIDDFNQNTIVAASSKEKVYNSKKINKTKLASLIGESLAERAKSKKVISVYFDRNGFKYHGRVKSLAEASRKGGLKF